MTAEIIQFGAASVSVTKTRNSLRVAGRDATLTTTAKNQRLRNERREAWLTADAITDYWLARLNFIDAASTAARRGLREEGCKITVATDEARWAVLDSYRAAVAKQLLTPAPDLAAVSWKRAHMNKPHIGVKQERAEQIIADDMAFLSAHPTRNLKAKA